jgi:hypothetical protein
MGCMCAALTIISIKATHRKAGNGLGATKLLVYCIPGNFGEVFSIELKICINFNAMALSILVAKFNGTLACKDYYSSASINTDMNECEGLHVYWAKPADYHVPICTCSLSCL